MATVKSFRSDVPSVGWFGLEWSCSPWERLRLVIQSKLYLAVTPSKRSVFKFPNFFPRSTVIFNSSKRSWSPLTESRRPDCIAQDLYWTINYSGTTQIKLGIIFKVKSNPCLTPEINFNSIFERYFVHEGSIRYKMAFFIVLLWYPYSLEPAFSDHLAIPHEMLLLDTKLRKKLVSVFLFSLSTRNSRSV